ncbi:hypothetical protein [Curtobacterium sp. MCBD17_021]|uniref:hypothetical protein n=1 Tax=Curtobacterium sp. MCBD17_021 TaxID=2175665 RepID=UPI000DA9360F|nr:hypothetical protein [Curtobacterium sp. MCBD17_021]PZE66912.1 hypothetical protein DEI83_06280 [Curtobacterium sp. MCBD17_021]
MTAPDPEQMRRRAADHDTAAQYGVLLKDAEAHRETAVMLRAAADQLEAVQDWADSAFVVDGGMTKAFNDGYICAARDLRTILTAETEPRSLKRGSTQASRGRRSLDAPHPGGP